MDIIKLPEYYKFIKSVDVTHHIQDENSNYYRAIIIFKDNSQLHIKEYFNASLNKHDYAFHWQNSNGLLIKRWDNTHHHKYIASFPFHLHVADKVLESEEVFLDDVLQTILNEISKKR